MTSCFVILDINSPLRKGSILKGKGEQIISLYSWPNLIVAYP